MEWDVCRNQFWIGTFVVGEYQDVLGVFAFVVAEIVVDALAFDQTRNEVEGGFVVLRAVLEALRVRIC